MKILHLASYYMEGLGYQENFLPHAQLKYLQENDSKHSEVTFLTSERSYPFDNFDDVYGKLLGERIKSEAKIIEVGVEFIKTKPIFESIKRKVCLLNPITIYRVLKNKKPDIIHLHGSTNLNLITLLLFSFFFDYKLFIDCHADSQNSNVKSISNKILYSLFSLIFKVFDKKVCLHLAVTDASREYLQKQLNINSNKIELTPLGYDEKDIYYDEVGANKVRTEFGIGDDIKLLGYFGKLSSEKKVYESLVIFNELLKKSLKLHFIVIGGGDPLYKSKLIEFIKLNGIESHVTFKPLQGRDVLRYYLSACEIAFWIGSASNSIQEAMACKTIPLLSHNLATKHLIISLNQLIEPKNITESVEKVMCLIEDENIKHDIYDSAVTKYNWCVIAAQHIEIYRRYYF